jgi:ribonuclease HI
VKAAIRIYTDGGCLGNPGPGGWAAVLTSGAHLKEISGRFRNTTNNRMELLGAIKGLEQVKNPSDVVVITDSAYLRNGITQWINGWQRNGWRTAAKKPVKNKDLWLRLLAAVARHEDGGGSVQWEWTKGHAGHELNERADTLANQAAHDVTQSDPDDRAD